MSNNPIFDEILKWQEASTQWFFSTAYKMTNVVRDGYLRYLVHINHTCRYKHMGKQKEAFGLIVVQN